MKNMAKQIKLTVYKYYCIIYIGGIDGFTIRSFALAAFSLVTNFWENMGAKRREHVKDSAAEYRRNGHTGEDRSGYSKNVEHTFPHILIFNEKRFHWGKGAELYDGHLFHVMYDALLIFTICI